MEQWKSAEHFFREYVNLILAGMKGTYGIEDAARHIRELHGHRQERAGNEIRKAIKSTLEHVVGGSGPGGKLRFPKLSLTELLPT